MAKKKKVIEKVEVIKEAEDPIEKLNKRIDRIVDAHEKCKTLKGL